MQTWKKVAIGAVSALTIAGGANLAALAAGTDDSPAVLDVKGPCDEAEHANDARCATTLVREDRAREREPGDDRGRERELRGREAENEAEHGSEDNSGRGSGNEGPSDRSGRGDGAGHDRGDDLSDERDEA